ncbi:ComF family protein [Collinsella sp. AGMB00827]|uniref:ComF family protein n=1 Tax=Collinsella ureilytica TaxID=2869515 RepID=A0ABS7MJE5_9ACTN|nr:ComF family protein [Collinsella urealyticum]MBY4797486.1 ComF family protein [Collinsella urealyticum]
MWRAVVEAVFETVSPTRCAGCERPGTLICQNCLNKLALIDPKTCCIHCGAPYGALLCTECDGQLGSLSRVLATAAFDDPLPRIIRAYKDAGERRLAKTCAALLLDTASNAEMAARERYGGILSAADALTFVPATAQAFRRRGFDHMEAIARALSELSGRPVIDALVKHGRTDQRRLGRSERLALHSKRYEVVADLCGAHLLLVDDVITTGATMASTAGALCAAGASRVDGLALARVW